MDSVTKRFLVDVFVVSVSAGTLWAFVHAIASGWHAGLIEGAIYGLFIGLAVAYLNARRSAALTYPLDIDGLGLAKETTTSLSVPKAEYELQRRWAFGLYAWIGIFILMVLYSIIKSDPVFFLQIALLVVVGSAVLLVSFIGELGTRLSVSPEGLEYRTMLYRIRVGWDCVEKIERRGKLWSLVCRNSKVIGGALVARWLRFLETDRTIPVGRFARDFLEGDLVKTILKQSPQVRLYSPL